MVYGCSICGKVYNFNASVSFHTIPRNECKRLAWFNSIGKKIKNFHPPVCAKVCSQHFTQDSFYWSIDGKHLLKTNAIPTLFHVTRPALEIYPDNENENDNNENLCENDANSTVMAVTPDSAITSSDSADEIHNLNAVCETLSTSKSTVLQTETHRLTNETRENIISIDEENSQNCNKMQKQLQEANARNVILQQKLTLLQQKNRRFEERIENLLTLLRHFYKRTKCYQKMLVRYSNKIITNTSNTL